MKLKTVEVKNVLRCEELFDNLNSRSAIVEGIGLVHGPSGFGKTTTMTWLFNQDHVDAVYVRCRATDTPSSLLTKIAFEMGLEPKYPLGRMVDDIVERMRYKELSLFIDEVDYVIGSTRIMESLRDIYDLTQQPVLLIGMDQIARRISHRKQLFNRISEWIEFQPADLEDVALFADELLENEIRLSEDLLDAIQSKANGEVRRILSALEKIERKAIAADRDKISLDDVDIREIFLDSRRR